MKPPKMRILLLIAIVGLASAETPDQMVDKFIRDTLEMLRPDMKTGFPKYGIPPLDPLAAPNMSFDVNETSLINVQFNISKAVITDLSKFITQLVNFNTDKLSLSIGFRFPLLKLTGNYSIKGKILVPVSFPGHMSANISNFRVNISTAIKREGKYIQLTTLAIQLEFDALQVELGNKGFVAKLISGIISSSAKSLFEKHRADIQKMLDKLLFDKANALLKKIPVGLSSSAPYALSTIGYSSADFNRYFDSAIVNLHPVLMKNDPLKLPDVHQVFQKKISFFTLKGTVSLTSGSIKGLTTLHRIGDAILSSDNSAAYISMNVGVSNLDVYYDCLVKWNKYEQHPKVTARVQHVGIFVKIRQDLVTGKRSLLSFKIMKIEQPKFKVHGMMPVLGKIASLVINLARRPVTEVLRRAIEREMRTEMAKAIRSDSIPIIPGKFL